MGKPLGTRLSQLLRKPLNAESNDDISLMTITAMMFLHKNEKLTYVVKSCAKKTSEKFHRIAVKKPILYGMGHAGHFSKPWQEGPWWFSCSASWVFFWISPDTSHSPGSGKRWVQETFNETEQTILGHIMRSFHQYTVCSCQPHPS